MDKLARRNRSKSIALTALGVGVAGWLLENALYPGRSSRFWQMLGVPASVNVPVMPTYVLGGAALAAMSPKLDGLHPVNRILVYAGALSFVELVSCKLDRATGGTSWSYGGDGADPEGCLDLPHALAWGVLAVAVEPWL